MDEHANLPDSAAPKWSDFTPEEQALIEAGSAEIAAGHGLPFKTVAKWLQDLEEDPQAPLPTLKRPLHDKASAVKSLWRPRRHTGCARRRNG